MISLQLSQFNEKLHMESSELNIFFHSDKSIFTVLLDCPKGRYRLVTQKNLNRQFKSFDSIVRSLGLVRPIGLLRESIYKIHVL